MIKNLHSVRVFEFTDDRKHYTASRRNRGDGWRVSGSDELFIPKGDYIERMAARRSAKATEYFEE